jgi:HTH-type transcriptional regulator/antitoxin HigA
MERHPIQTEQEYDAALRAIEALWTAPAGSPEAEQLESLVTLVEAYEATHHPIAPPDPIDAITFRMEQAGLSLQDLEAYLGRHAADVLARKRPLTLAMRQRVQRGLGIAADVLLQ